MIVSWEHKGLQRFFETGSKAGIQPAHEKRLRRQLYALNNAKTVDALNVPGWRLHSLLGDRQEYWFLTVSGNCCITFKFIDTDVYVVNYEDYH